MGESVISGSEVDCVGADDVGFEDVALSVGAAIVSSFVPVSGVFPSSSVLM
jgi:hypothetical protein